MLDRHHRRHTVAHVRPREIGVLLLQDPQIPRICIDDVREHGLKARQMRAALGIVYIVAEPQHILMELIDVLKSHLNGNPLALPAEIDDVMHRLLGLVHILHKARDAVRLMERHRLRRFPPPVLEYDRQIRIQISRLMQTALHILLLEPGLLENRIVRQEIDGSPGLLRLPQHRKQPVLKLHHRISPLIPVLIDKAAGLDRHGQPGGKRVHHRRPHPVQPPAGLIRRIVELSPRMKRGKDQPLRTDSLLMHPHRDAAPVIYHRSGSVRLQHHPDCIAYPRQMLIHRIVHDFINQMVQPLRGHAADIHPRPLPHSLQPLQHRNAGGIIIPNTHTTRHL